jgi:hypothetical protein
MSASSWGAAVDNILTAISAQSGCVRWNSERDMADGLIAVMDGPEADTTSDTFDFVAVGYAGANDTASGSANFMPGPIGTNRPRDEDGSVTCWAYANSGNSIAEARTNVTAILDKVDAAVRTSATSITGNTATIRWGLISSISWEQSAGGGYDCSALFTITYTART